MDEPDLLAQRFEPHRARLNALAHRMLGSEGAAEDTVQEAWLRLSRSGVSAVENPAGWLTTVMSQVCLDRLRTRASSREQPLDDQVPAASVDGRRPEHDALLGDALGVALLVVLAAMTPSERLAFVLHDLLALPYDEIAGIVGCSPAAARQFVLRARRRVQGV